jgi:hypothetical protein
VTGKKIKAFCLNSIRSLLSFAGLAIVAALRNLSSGICKKEIAQGRDGRNGRVTGKKIKAFCLNSIRSLLPFAGSAIVAALRDPSSSIRRQETAQRRKGARSRRAQRKGDWKEDKGLLLQINPLAAPLCGLGVRCGVA